MLRGLGKNITEAELLAMINETDSQGNHHRQSSIVNHQSSIINHRHQPTGEGSLDFSAFYQLLKTHSMPNTPQYEEVVGYFDTFDRNSDGIVYSNQSIHSD